MYKTPVLILILLVVSHCITLGQEKETVLAAPDNWKSEIISFPLGFAPAIDFVGFEDLRFSPGWSDATSPEFWTYVFAWYIEKDSAMTVRKLTESFTSYYDGLMGVDLKNQADTSKANQIKKTICLFTRTSDGFTGKISMHDAFFTKDDMILHTKIKEYFCPATNRQIVVCYLSPKAFDHKVWEIFNDVTLIVKCK